uniref:non-specific serine/threonine protein kinase n=1 Tax=Elaeophora elaphi TaxID=1147741 RepID=A0A0R3RJV3_9BILA
MDGWMERDDVRSKGFVIINGFNKQDLQMMTANSEQFERQKKAWNLEFDSDRFKRVIRLPRELRSIEWNVVRTLGDGAFGEVRLLVDSKNPETMVAAKCMAADTTDKKEQENLYKKLRQEAFIMRVFHRSEYVIHYIGMRYDEGRIEMFLEYADGGELFDHIEPDTGMPAQKAQEFFRQIIAGLKHIHSMGIVHRDIKPENLLLMKNGQLKICDFGAATIFRRKGVERKLKSKCGTVQYLSPQVLAADYRGEPSDIWSCGIVLIAMLTGELPWDEAAKTSQPFKLWLTKYDWRRHPPWDRLLGAITNLLRKMLDVCENRRIKIPEIEEHEFFTKEIDYEIPSASSIRKKRIKPVETTGGNPTNLKEHGEVAGPSNLIEETVVEDEEEPDSKKIRLSAATNTEEILEFGTVSQPVSSCCDPQIMKELQLSGNFFSQPVDVELLTPIDYGHPLELLARRMTRFCVTKRAYEIMSIIKERLGLKFTCVRRAANMMSVSGPRNHICYVITIYEIMGEDGRKVVVDCRRSRGDGIEFKRAFLDLKHKLSDVICESDNTWLQRQGLVTMP